MKCSLCKKDANVFYCVDESGRQLCEECYAVWTGDYHVCKICGKLQPATLTPELGEILKRDGICFECWIWLTAIEMKDDPRSVRVDHCCYFIGDDGTSFRGFGGRHFTIKFHDGRVVETDNLWCQGKIPERFWSDLPDNAQFV